jgi:hypothetical protein
MLCRSLHRRRCAAACGHPGQNATLVPPSPALLDEQGRPNFDLNFYAVAKQGQVVAASMHPGHNFVVCHSGEQPQMLDCTPLFGDT